MGMKKVIMFLMGGLLFAFQINIENSPYKIVNTNFLDIHSNTKKIKSSFDIKRNNYTFVTLKYLFATFCPKHTGIKFEAIDGYEVTFNKKEIKTSDIVFAYKIDNKKIPIEQKGPAKIIYLHNPNPLKEIFLINKIKCVDE
jgi:hypothetical protein